MLISIVSVIFEDSNMPASFLQNRKIGFLHLKAVYPSMHSSFCKKVHFHPECKISSKQTTTYWRVYYLLQKIVLVALHSLIPKRR